VYALVDGNNFYVSCERVFRPSLHNAPVVVLSNNDGCAISRSNEAKSLGIAMGAPWFKIKELEETQGLVSLSANFALYGDLSDRMMSLVAGLGHRQEIYSIDESFVDVSGIRGDITQRAFKIRARVLQWVGIPCCVGIGDTKTLAKLANHIAKTAERKPGVYPDCYAQVCHLSACTPEQKRLLLQATDVSEVWGVGRRISGQLREAGIHTAWDLMHMDLTLARTRWSVVLERTVRELQGTPSIDLDDAAPNKKEIACTRSFGEPIVALSHLQQAVTEFASRAAEKMRRQKSCALQVLCFIRTSPFRVKDAQYSRSVVMPLMRATDDSHAIVQAALAGLSHIYQAGFKYAKAGVMLLDLQPSHWHQHELQWIDSMLVDSNSDAVKKQPLMLAMDQLNTRYGRGTLQIASAGEQAATKPWAMKQGRRTPDYTTSWDALPLARA